MEIIHRPDSFEFYNNLILHHEVDALGWQRLAPILADKRNLPCIAETGTIELRAKSRLVHGFQ